MVDLASRCGFSSFRAWSIPSRSAWIALLLLGLVHSTAAGAGQQKPSVADARAKISAGDHAGAVKILEKITSQQPGNGSAWQLLGYSYQAQGKLDKAIPAHLQAAKFPRNAPTALYNAACAYALKGDVNRAFQYLQRAGATGGVDLRRALTDPDLESLREDPRFAGLIPPAEAFAEPFVEDVFVLQEWSGEQAGSQFGWIARNVGDVDGDGFDDVVTSAPTLQSGGPAHGRVYVYSSATGELLWQRDGQPGESLGMGVEAAGDVDGDGVPDVVAGAPTADRCYLLSGVDGSVLQQWQGEAKGGLFGRKVSDIGDWNGDGHGDVVVGAPQNDAGGQDAGRSYVYSGKDGSLLLKLTGERAGDRFGSSGNGWVGEQGKLLVIGAPNAGARNAGRTYVYDGNGKQSFVIEADATGAQLGGMFVSVVGDVDADGMPDVYASDWSDNARGQSTGRVYIHSGRTGERLHILTGEAAGDGFGIGTADVGDVDEDGHDDLLIGAWQHAGAARSGGKCYVYSGKTGELLSAITCQVPGDTFGFDTTGIGDLDEDGLPDFLITSAWSGINGTRSGRMFILSGDSGSAQE